MVNIKTLLPDLKELVKELAEDLLPVRPRTPRSTPGCGRHSTQIEKGGRTAQAYEVWREDYLDQVAVAWVLACVFVRFMEDNHLIDECWLAGEGERRRLAEDTHELFFREHPHDTDREYFQHVFHEVGKIPAAKDLFAEGKTPLWAVAPSGDAAMKLLAFWREINPRQGTSSGRSRSRAVTLASWVTSIRNSPRERRRSTPCCKHPCSSRSSSSTGRSTRPSTSSGSTRCG